MRFERFKVRRPDHRNRDISGRHFYFCMILIANKLLMIEKLHTLSLVFEFRVVPFLPYAILAVVFVQGLALRTNREWRQAADQPANYAIRRIIRDPDRRPATVLIVEQLQVRRNR